VELPLIVPTAQGHWDGLMAEASYLLRLAAACPTLGTSHVDVPIVVNVPPTVSPISVNPSEGVAFQTIFEISGGSAKDVYHDYPLRYQWAAQQGSDITPFEMGSSTRNVHTYLPPG